MRCCWQYADFQGQSPELALGPIRVARATHADFPISSQRCTCFRSHSLVESLRNARKDRFRSPWTVRYIREHWPYLRFAYRYLHDWFEFLLHTTTTLEAVVRNHIHLSVNLTFYQVLNHQVYHVESALEGNCLQWDLNNFCGKSLIELAFSIAFPYFPVKKFPGNGKGKMLSIPGISTLPGKFMRLLRISLPGNSREQTLVMHNTQRIEALTRYHWCWKSGSVGSFSGGSCTRFSTFSGL